MLSFLSITKHINAIDVGWNKDRNKFSNYVAIH